MQALARPYASVWLTGENVVMQDTTMELLRLYEQGGFAIDDNFQELPDHVAVELEFLYLLTHQLDQAQGSGDAEALQALQVLRTAFLDGHLGRWLGGFDRMLRAPLLSPFVGQDLRAVTASEDSADMVILKDMIEAGSLKPVVDRAYPLDQTGEAFRHLERWHARGKVVITV